MEKKKKEFPINIDYGRVFPAEEEWVYPQDFFWNDGKVVHTLRHGGLTLRDYFAAMAIAGRGVAGSAEQQEAIWRHANAMAKSAYALADAMLEARKKGGDS